jgi:hypothetical protein
MEQQRQQATHQPELESAAHFRPPTTPAQPHAHPFAQLQRAVGNQAFGHVLQTKLRVSEPGDAFEQEADRVAAQVVNSAAPASVTGRVGTGQVQRACKQCEEEEDERHSGGAGHDVTVQRKQAGTGNTGAGGATRAAQANVPGSGGEPISAAVRGYFEPRFGQDFSDVRVHADAGAAGSARSLGALAYTVGQNIVFGEGQYAPQTESGRKLLAHELAHTIQQGALTTSEPVVMRQGDPNRFGLGAGLPSFSLPSTGLFFQPGPLTATLPGTRLPFPASLRVTNALSLTGLGAPGIPSFVLDLNPDIFMATILQNIDLTTSTSPGTPPGREGEAAYQDHISLVNPRLFFNTRTGQISGRAILSVPSGYPRPLRPYNEFPVEFQSTDLTQFTGQLSYGPVHLNFSLNLHYDTARLEEAVRPAFAPTGGFAGFWGRFQAILRRTVPGERLGSIADSLQALLRSIMNGTLDAGEFATQTIQLIAQSVPAGVSPEALRTALTQLANEITHPGFSVSGSLRLGPVPLSTFSASAPTTVPLPHPLLGAPASFPITTSAGGVVLAPPGSITDIAVPALGYSYSSFGATAGTSFTSALLPTLSPSAISAGQPFVRQFPVYAFAEVSHVRRITTGFDLGVRATLQVSTPDFAGRLPPSADPVERFRQTHQDYLDASNRTSAPTPSVPNIGLSVFGRFSGPF